jgi:hypothetical protein
MIAVLIVALLGYASVRDDYGQFTVWTHDTACCVEQASRTPKVAYPDGEYLRDGAKPIAWASSAGRPDGRFFTPITVSKASHWAEAKDAPKAKDTRKQEISDKKASNTEVDTDKILSYFESVGFNKSSHEEIGNFAIPNQAVPQLPDAFRPAPAVK